MKKIIITGLIFLALLAVNAHAMSVEHIDNLQTYNPVGLVTIFGTPIDMSTAGYTFNLGDTGGVNHTLVYLNSPDGTTHEWYVWVRMINSSVSSTTQIEQHPPSLSFTLTCGTSGATYNISHAASNSTWWNGYTLFKLAYDTESMLPYAVPTVDNGGNLLVSPTGRDLLTLSRECYFAVNPDEWGDPDTEIRVSVWNVNPSKAAMCGQDEAVQYIQQSAAGIVSINIQVWTIAFQIFTIAVIIGSIFGLPLFVLKLIRWTMSELKSKKRI